MIWSLIQIAALQINDIGAWTALIVVIGIAGVAMIAINAKKKES